LGAPRLQFARRPKNRVKRWLLFRLRLAFLPQPFRGAVSFLEPMAKWGVASWPLPAGPHVFPAGGNPTDPVESELDALGPFIALAPSAAWEMKRWPPEHWRRLIALLPEARFALLGGPGDGFCEAIRAVAPERVLNLAGRLDLQGSLRAIARSSLTIANDTGLLHASDLMGQATLAIVGPTAFGYPSGPRSEALEIELPCKPCTKDGRGRCRNSLYKRCLLELAPERVAEAARRALAARPPHAGARAPSQANARGGEGQGKP
jgi:heptosyltransferase-2